MEILLADDSPSDVFIVKQALKRAGGENNLHVVHDGVEAMEYLRREGEFFDAPRPDVMLLDLNMPRKDGREVLAEVKSDESLKSIPIIVLTSSDAEQDVSIAYHLHANCYITKPSDYSKLKQMIKEIEGFWFSKVTLPPNANR